MDSGLPGNQVGTQNSWPGSATGAEREIWRESRGRPTWMMLRKNDFPRALWSTFFYFFSSVEVPVTCRIKEHCHCNVFYR